LDLGAAIRNSIADAGKSLTDARDAADAARKLLRDGQETREDHRQETREDQLLVRPADVE
jgi:hypothetical protein